MSLRAATWLALASFAISFVVSVAFLVLLGLNAGTPVGGTRLFGSHSAEAVIVVPILAFAAVGALVASRRPYNPIGWIFCCAGVLLGISQTAVEYGIRALIAEPGSLPGGAWAAWVSWWLFIPAIVLPGIYLLLLFPDGKLLSRRWRWVLAIATLGVVAVTIGLVFSPGSIDDDPFQFVTNPAGIEQAQGVLDVVAFPAWLLFLGGFVAAGVSMALRFRRSGHQVRAQIKWVTAAALLFVVSFFTVAMTDASRLANTIAVTVWFISLTLIPVASGIAILKYRLFEIDLIVRKTLVYGIVTVGLAGLYFGIVIGLQQIFSGFTRGNDLAIAGSTLAVAALFRPARRRIQAFVDRRFYRQRYNADKTLQGFSSRLRDEVDLDQLGADLCAVVHETMQPTHVSLWLRSTVQQPPPGLPQTGHADGHASRSSSS
jgi:hypothetical protein